jgi:hypothetical protein
MLGNQLHNIGIFKAIIQEEIVTMSTAVLKNVEHQNEIRFLNMPQISWNIYAKIIIKCHRFPTFRTPEQTADIAATIAASVAIYTTLMLLHCALRIEGRSGKQQCHREVSHYPARVSISYGLFNKLKIILRFDKLALITFVFRFQ